MADRITAETQLARILELLPRAARAEGASLQELSTALAMEPREILRDLTEVYTRAYYQPAGTGDDVQILIDGEHVTVWTTGEFRRPTRLSPRESLALGLALRVHAASNAAVAEDLTSLAARLEGRLLDERASREAARFAMSPNAVPGERTHRVLAAAAGERRRCRIEYLKPLATAPESREIDPYVLLESGGLWYVVGLCGVSRAVRAFRFDRILDVSPLDTTFEPDEDFDPLTYVSGGRVYRADEVRQVTVRYSARVARWIAEHGPVETQGDGSVLVHYPVSDPAWLVRHVLEHAPDAEVVEPADIRRQVEEVARKVLQGD